jgi:putative endopeptidase
MIFLATSTALAATTALTGCATVPASEPLVAPVVAAPAEPVAEAAPAAKPELGTYGFDATGMDTTVLPGNNFFKFANGTWVKTTPIPEDKSNYGMFTKLDDLSRDRTRGLIEEAAKDPESRIGAVYASFMDEAALEAKGLAGLNPWFQQVRSLRSVSELPKIYAAASRMGVGTPFGGFVGQDDKQPDQYILSMFQSGLGMPDRDYYLSKDAKLVETRGKYLAHLTNMLTLAGEKNAAARAKAVVAFETKIAAASWTRVESRDATKTYNKMTLAELAKRAPGFDFTRLVRESGAANVDSLIVAQPSAITAIAALVSKAPLGVLKDH